MIHTCKFCGDECDGKLVLVSADFKLKDEGDITLCPTCINLYAAQKWDELTKRLRK